jgi:hypothetical protein
MHAMQRLQTNKGAGRPPPTPGDPRKKEQAAPAVQLQQRNQSNTVLHTHIHANEILEEALHVVCVAYLPAAFDLGALIHKAKHFRTTRSNDVPLQYT